MNINIKKFGKKGQSLVEYTFVLAFIVVLIVGVYNADFRDQIRTIFDRVVAAFVD